MNESELGFRWRMVRAVLESNESLIFTWLFLLFSCDYSSLFVMVDRIGKKKGQLRSWVVRVSWFVHKTAHLFTVQCLSQAFRPWWCGSQPLHLPRCEKEPDTAPPLYFVPSDIECLCLCCELTNRQEDPVQKHKYIKSIPPIKNPRGKDLPKPCSLFLNSALTKNPRCSLPARTLTT